MSVLVCGRLPRQTITGKGEIRQKDQMMQQTSVGNWRNLDCDRLDDLMQSLGGGVEMTSMVEA